MSNFVKILLVGAELFHADRRKDMTKLTVAFRNFANANKKRPNFETAYLQLRLTTLRPNVTNERIAIVITLIFSTTVDLSQHSIPPKRLCQTPFQLAIRIRVLP